MKRLIAVLAVLLAVPLAGGLAWAAEDLLHIGRGRFQGARPSALEGSYQTAGGQLQFLVLASPGKCNDGSDPTLCPKSLRVYFYNQSCNRINDIPVSLTENAVAVLPLHSPAVTPNRAGNFLVSGVSAATPAQPLLASNALAGLSLFVDVNQGIGRSQELSRLDGDGWPPYDAGAVLLFAPPDDGVTFTNTLLVRCPVGATAVIRSVILGTPGTLGGDMLDVANQLDNDAPPGAVAFIGGAADRFTLRDQVDEGNEGVFAVSVTALVLDTNGNFLGVTSFPCQCYTEQRLAAASPVAGVAATYWELFGVGPHGLEGLFTAAFNMRLHIGSLNGNFAHRLHRTWEQEAFFP